MNNRLKGIGLVKKISIPATLLNLPVGKPVLIPTEKINTNSIRTACSRLEKSKKGRFFVTTEGLINETKVMRIV